VRIFGAALVAALCVVALPALAASPQASCPAAPETSPSDATGAPDELKLLVPMLPPYCWDLDRTYCSPVGSTKTCTDGIYSDYVCVCRYDSYYRTNYWDCPEVR
jgi:hypothetical protein